MIIGLLFFGGGAMALGYIVGVIAERHSRPVRRVQPRVHILIKEPMALDPRARRDLYRMLQVRR